MVMTPHRDGSIEVGNEEGFGLLEELVGSADSNGCYPFLYSVSHDLRAPMRTIRGYAVLLKETAGSKLNASEKEMLERIISATEHSQRLMANLLWLSCQHQPIENSKFKISEAIAIASNSMASFIGLSKAIITVNCPDSAIAIGDVELTSSVFSNLLSNSIKYKREEFIPRITISVEAMGDFWQVSVADNGIGIPEFVHGRLFEPFYRASTNNDVKGNGIGLKISKEIVERQGGRIWVSSPPRMGGTTISFALKKGN